MTQSRSTHGEEGRKANGWTVGKTYKNGEHHSNSRWKRLGTEKDAFQNVAIGTELWGTHVKAGLP